MENRGGRVVARATDQHFGVAGYLREREYRRDTAAR
jgi:hypothetical protein